MSNVIYEYSILRYVPDIERGEFINVGLIMMCKRYRWIKVELRIDTVRIKALYPMADIKRAHIQLQAFVGGQIPYAEMPVEERYRWIVAAKSAIIQCSPSHPGIIMGEENMAKHDIEMALEEKFNNLIDRLVGVRF